MKIVDILKRIARDSGVARIFMRSVFYGIRKIKYRINGMFIKMESNMVAFCSYGGKSYSCSPKAIYEYMLSDSRFNEYEFIWIFDDTAGYGFLEDSRNTVVVRKDSSECEKLLHKAGYWIFNFRAPDHWMPRRDQKYIQCWHGTPLKRLGYDIVASENAMNSIKEIRDKYRTDAAKFCNLLSSCEFVTEKFSSAWNLKYPEKTILEVGYPRNDFLNNYSTRDVDVVRKRLGLDNRQKTVILYAPTWRDDQFDPKQGYVYDSPVDFDQLEEILGDDYVILFRAHYMVADNFDFQKYEGFIYDVSGYDDINELYIVSDILVTDYSSVFFDYAILERPILFFMYDMEKYRDDIRGFYMDIDELPGPVVRTESELAESIMNVKQSNDKDAIKRFNMIYNTKNDGMAAKRLAEKIF